MPSILAADFGSVHTRLLMLDLVDGSYRLVARSLERTTTGFPYNDVAVGMKRGLVEISSVTGRKLLGEDGRVLIPEQDDRSGVDEFVATASAGRPLRTFLVGLVPEISIASGLRAAAGTYVEIVDSFSLNDNRDEEEKLNALVSSNPDLILITGGTEFGAREPVLDLVESVQLGLNLLERSQRPVILYAGNAALAPEIRARFGSLTRLFIAPNVRPSMDHEDLDGAQLQLGLAFDAFKENRGEGFGAVGDMSNLGILPTAQGYNLMVEYLGRGLDQQALVVDVGSAVSSMSAFVGGDVHTSIHTDIGQGHSAYALLELLGFDPINRWLPFISSMAEITTYARNKMLRPATIPETPRELYIEHALLRAGISQMVIASRPAWFKQAHLPPLGELPAFNPIVGAGAALTQTGSGGLTAMLLLDALQPEGITDLYTDPYGLMPAMGALAYFKPEAVVQVMERTGLETIGTAISLSGYPRPERPALQVTIRSEEETVEQRINGGHLWVYPLPIGQEAEVQIRVMGRGVTLNGKRRLKLRLMGGTGGLIFDARGRALPLATKLEERAAQMVTWFAEATGQPVMDIPEDWLQDTGGAEVSTAARAVSSRRGHLRRLDQEAVEAERDAEENELAVDDILDALS